MRALEERERSGCRKPTASEVITRSFTFIGTRTRQIDLGSRCVVRAFDDLALSMGCGASTLSPPEATAAGRIERLRVQGSGNDNAEYRIGKLQEVFQAIDIDSNGTIDWREFIMTKKEGDSEVELKMLFQFLDSENREDQKVTLNEWVSGMSKIPSSDLQFAQEMQSLMDRLAARKQAAGVSSGAAP